MTTVNADFVHEDIDNNYKTETVAGISNLKVFSDEFGSVLTPQFTTTGSILSIAERGTVTEASNKITMVVTSGTGTGGKILMSPQSFGDFDLWTRCSYVTGTPSGNNYWGIIAYVDDSNFAFLYVADGVGKLYFLCRVAGVDTLKEVNILSDRDMSLRLVRAGNVVTAFYDLSSGTSWTQHTTPTTAAIGTTSKLVAITFANNLNLTVDFHNFTITGTSYYWNDSPETHLITTGQTYLVDAGVGKTLKYNSQTATETLGSGSNIKYKWASDANGTYATASFNATWLTAAELDTALLANNGSFDRYLYIKAQYNSTGAGASLKYDIDWEEYTSGSGTNIISMGRNIFGKIINSRKIISTFKNLLAA